MNSTPSNEIETGEADTPSVDDVQYGGDHYKQGGELQHWNMLLIVGFGAEYYIGAATKYASRHAKKNGAQDVAKAIHFVDKLLDAITKGQVPEIFETRQGFRYSIDSNPAVPYDKTVNVEQLCNRYFDANGIDNLNARTAIRYLFEARSSIDLVLAKGFLTGLLGQLTEPVAAPAEPTPAERQAAQAATAATTLGANPVVGSNSPALTWVDEGGATGGYTNQAGDEPQKPVKRKSTARKSAKPE